jgi:hypothetical protein
MPENSSTCFYGAAQIGYISAGGWFAMLDLDICRAVLHLTGEYFT